MVKRRLAIEDGNRSAVARIAEAQRRNVQHTAAKLCVALAKLEMAERRQAEDLEPEIERLKKSLDALSRKHQVGELQSRRSILFYAGEIDLLIARLDAKQSEIAATDEAHRHVQAALEAERANVSDLGFRVLALERAARSRVRLALALFGIHPVGAERRPRFHIDSFSGFRRTGRKSFSVDGAERAMIEGWLIAPSHKMRFGEMFVCLGNIKTPCVRLFRPDVAATFFLPTDIRYGFRCEFDLSELRASVNLNIYFENGDFVWSKKLGTMRPLITG